MTVEKANALYQYRPYAGQYRKEAVGDTYMKGFGSRHDTIRYYPYKKLSQTKVPKAWRNMEADYQSFVRRVYTDVPEHVRQVFRDEANTRITGLDIDTIAQEIAALLAEQTRYSIYPGATPKGEDFAEYFYFQNKKGYCSHYATVAVLLFRMKGIPARYVAGYVVEPGEFVRDTDGRYAANVTGESAHAWAEVYKPGEGWIPIETTPGYIAEEFREHIPQPQEEVVLPAGEETEQPETERPQEKQEQPEREEAADQADELNAAGDIRKKERREGAEQGKHRGYAAVVCAAVGICAVILYRQLLARRRKRHSGQTNYNQKTQELFYRIFKKLKKERIVTEETPLNQVFVEKLCGAYADISEEEAVRLLELVNRANFGRKELEREEYLFCRQMIFILEKKV